MIEQLRKVIDGLREELKQYGEMLARLDEQQDYVMRRSTDGVILSVSAIESQSAVIQQARHEREGLQRTLARQCELVEDAPFSDIVPRIPEDYRPLVQALVQENNELLTRVQQRARQNHLLLRRSLDMMQAFLNTLVPVQPVPVYNGSGHLFGAQAAPAAAMYEAIG
jgi:flagellar biosynthesis/type III secretory pathway chaperone